MKIYDNLLTDVEQDELEKVFMSPGFPWYWVDEEGSYTSAKKWQKIYADKNTKETKLMAHTFYNFSEVQSDAFPIIEKLLYKFLERTKQTYARIFRCKINLQYNNPNYPENSYVCPHIDMANQKHNVLLYYPINSDGNTIFFKNKDRENLIIEKEVKPKKGRFILFDGNTMHSNRPPKISETRMTINYNIGQ